MPHSPRIHPGKTWLLDSGHGRLVIADTERGTVSTVIELPGYTRGLAMIDTFAFVGLSRIRETSTFGGLPIAASRESLKCGVAVVDLVSGKQMAFLEFHTGVEEIFDIQILPGMRSPVMSGPASPSRRSSRDLEGAGFRSFALMVRLPVSIAWLLWAVYISGGRGFEVPSRPFR